MNNKNWELKKVYSAHESLDKEADRGGSKLLGYFFTESDAEQVAAGKGCWGGPGNVRRHEAIVVDGYVYLLESNTPVTMGNAAIQHILNKLSFEEIKILKDHLTKE